MIVRRLRPQKTAKVSEAREDRKPSRVGRYLALIFGTGVVSGVAALAGIPPFGTVQALLGPISQVRHPQPPAAPIQAGTIFPPVQPVHKVVDVYDPPPPAQHSNPPLQPPATTPTPSPRPSPRPTHSPHPTPSASPTPIHSSPSPTPGGD